MEERYQGTIMRAKKEKKPLVGFEPTACALRERRSTTKPQRHHLICSNNFSFVGNFFWHSKHIGYCLDDPSFRTIVPFSFCKNNSWIFPSQMVHFAILLKASLFFKNLMDSLYVFEPVKIRIKRTNIFSI